MRPETALAALHVTGGTVIRSLQLGPLAHSWLVEYGDERAVLRIDQPAAAAMGLDRAAEFARLAAVASVGLGPPPIAAEPAQGLLLRRHIEGRAWRATDLRSLAKLQRAAVLLRRVHGVQVTAGVLDLQAAVDRYARLAGPEASPLAAAAASQLARCRDPRAALVFCHNDPVADNFVAAPGSAGRLWLIDWEYSGFNEFWFDLAVVLGHHELPAARAGGFLGAYFGRPAAPAEVQRLADWCTFYASLARLWFAALERYSANHP
ncbi:MAG: phosphotransferase family protein [Gammaproteobacteria bacterium]|nr:phosphotransferase family protein [Gammaproteobacteria bacterium]